MCLSGVFEKTTMPSRYLMAYCHLMLAKMTSRVCGNVLARFLNQTAIDQSNINRGER